MAFVGFLEFVQDVLIKAVSPSESSIGGLPIDMEVILVGACATSFDIGEPLIPFLDFVWCIFCCYLLFLFECMVLSNF